MSIICTNVFLLIYDLEYSVISKKPVESRQSTNLCKSNLSTITAEGSQTSQ